MTKLDLLTFRIVLMSQRRELTFPNDASVIKLPLPALGELSCCSSVRLLNYS